MADHQQPSVVGLASFGRVSRRDVTVSRDLLSFRRGDAARSEFVESDLGGKELLNSIGHTEGVSKPTNTGRALRTRFVGGR